MIKTIISQPTQKNQVTKYNCSNRMNHVSAYPGANRVRCPVCSQYPCLDTPVYVEKVVER
jgi:hypothetical protein